MCDAECRKRFRSIEHDVSMMSADIGWIKGSVKWVVILVAAALGIDVTGVL